MDMASRQRGYLCTMWLYNINKLVGMPDEHKYNCIKTSLQEVTQIMNFHAAVFQNIIEDPEKLNVQSLDGTHQTFNSNFICIPLSSYSYSNTLN
jgi:hypothetical protein